MPFSDFTPGFGPTNVGDLPDQDVYFLERLNEAYRKATADSPIGSHDLPNILTPDQMHRLLRLETDMDPNIPSSWSSIGLGAVDIKVKNAYQLAVNAWVHGNHPFVGTHDLDKMKDRLFKKLNPAKKVEAPKPAAPQAASTGVKKSALAGLPQDQAGAFRPDVESVVGEVKPAAQAQVAPQAPQEPVAAAAGKPATPAPEAPKVAAPVAATVVASAAAAVSTPAVAAKASAPKLSQDGVPIIENGLKRMVPPPVGPAQPKSPFDGVAEEIARNAGQSMDATLAKSNQQLDETLARINLDIEEAARRAEASHAATAPNVYVPADGSEELTASQHKALEQYEENQALLNDEEFCTISNGGETVDPQPLKVETLEEKMVRLGFPPRPRLWPQQFAWPMIDDLRKFEQFAHDEQKKQAYIKILRDNSARLLARAEQMHRYIIDSQVEGAFPGSSRKNHLEASKTDPHYGVLWATLLSEHHTKGAHSIVTSWSHNQARTIDGGIVTVYKDRIDLHNVRLGLAGKFATPTEQAIELALREGQARGWPSFKCRGNRDFALMVAKKAKELGIHAEITLVGLPFKKIIVAPPPPQLDMTLDQTAAPAPASQAPANAPQPKVENPEAAGEDPFARKKGKKQENTLEDDPDVSAMG